MSIPQTWVSHFVSSFRERTSMLLYKESILGEIMNLLLPLFGSKYECYE